MLQTTPLNGQLNYIRCGPTTTLDDVAPHMFPFALTNAWEQLRFSVDQRASTYPPPARPTAPSAATRLARFSSAQVDPANSALSAALSGAGISGSKV